MLTGAPFVRVVALLGRDWIRRRALEAGNRGTDELPEPAERDASPRDVCGRLRRLLVLPRGTEVRAPALVRHPRTTVARQAGQERRTTRRRNPRLGLLRILLAGETDRDASGRGCGTGVGQLRLRFRLRLLAGQTDRHATRFRGWRLGQSTRIGPSVRNADLRQLRWRCIRRRLDGRAGSQGQTSYGEHPDEHAPSGATSNDPAHGPPCWVVDRVEARPPPPALFRHRHARRHLERERRRGRPRGIRSIAGTNAYIVRSGDRGSERPRAYVRGFLPAKPISLVIGTFDPAVRGRDVSSSPFVRHYESTGSQISALSRHGAWRKPGHRRLLQRDMQHGEVMKSLLGGELVAHSLNSSGQDRGDFA